MPEVSRFFGIVITMFYDEHDPPHFHARYAGKKAAIEISSLRVLEGRLAPRVLGLVVEWASAHQDELLANWNAARNDLPPEGSSHSGKRRDTMLHDVVAAIYQVGYKIQVQFDDGASGLVDFSKYLERGGVFERFKDMEFFRRFSVNEELGTITWGNDVDIAPETLYAAATGTALPGWMEAEPEKAEQTLRTAN